MVPDITATVLKSKNKFITILFYLIPFVYVDRYGFSFLLSAYCITIYMYDNKLQNPGLKNENKSMLILVTTLCTLLYMLMVYIVMIDKSGIFKKGLTINGFEFIPSYLVIPFYIMPLMYAVYIDKTGLKHLFMLNVKKVIYILLLCCPIVVFNIYSVFFTDLVSILNSVSSGETTTSKALFGFIQAFIIAALLEELYFRVLIYNLLKKICYSITLAQIISACIFTIAHITLITSLFYAFNYKDLFNLIEIFILGIVATKMFEYAKSLVPCIMLHGLINGGFRYLLILGFTIIDKSAKLLFS